MTLRLIVGLGNPGPEYEATRHNAGVWLLHEIAAHYAAPFRTEKKFFGQFAKLTGAIFALQPNTYMNLSGQSISALARFHKISANEILVLHDELDLPPGCSRLKFGGGTGGHNGLKDATRHLGTPDYWRLRIGIGHPGQKNKVERFVLSAPSSKERQLIDHSIQSALDVLPQLIRGELDAAMNSLNTTTA